LKGLDAILVNDPPRLGGLNDRELRAEFTKVVFYHAMNCAVVSIYPPASILEAQFASTSLGWILRVGVMFGIHVDECHSVTMELHQSFPFYCCYVRFDALPSKHSY